MINKTTQNIQLYVQKLHIFDLLQILAKQQQGFFKV